MKFTGHFTGPNLDLRVWKAQLRSYLEPKLNEYVRSWLTAVTGRVPVWSGMAQASLLEITELVNGRLVITPKSGVKSRIPEGESLGSAEKTIAKGDFTITIITRVPHYVLQEYKRASRGGSLSAPWFSQLAGMIAFKSVAKDVTLPPVRYKPFVKVIS